MSMKGKLNTKGDSLHNDRSVENVMQIIQELFKMRLIQHLSMPVNKQKKLTLLTKFRDKMNTLHALLIQVQKSGWKDIQTVSTKDKSKSKNCHDSKQETNQRDHIKQVQTAYNELFIEGSFKHYKKVAIAFNFPQNMEPMDMTVWGRSYLEESSDETSCCRRSCCN